MTVVKYYVSNPVRDLMWVESRCISVSGRAVRYAIFYYVPNGTFRSSVITFFYRHCVPNGTVYNAIHNYIHRNK